MAKKARIWDGSAWIDISSGLSAGELAGYLTEASASATYLRQDTASASYLPISASSNYLFIDTASATYLRQDSASAEYLTKTDASNIYFPISSSGSLLTESEASAIYAPLSSPSFTGTPLAPTAASGTNTTQIATTEFVRTEVSALVDSAPSTLDTLNELAAALGDDPNFATTITNLISAKLDAGTASTLYLPISGSINWSNIISKPTTLSGYGITDALPASASSNFAPLTISTNAQTSSAYTLALSDAGKIIEMNNAAANLVIIPLNSTAAFPVGTKIDIIQTGAGATSASVVSGVTLNSEAGKRTVNAQWQAATLVKRATDTWVMIGAIKA